MGTAGNRDCQWDPRSVLKDFTKDALTVSAGSLFQNGTARIVKAIVNCFHKYLSPLNLYLIIFPQDTP